VQRFEHGRVVSFAGTFAGGRLFSLAVSRFIRTWPTPLGSASFNVTIEPNAEPTERVVRLLELVGWEGIFQLQLLELPDGRLEPIDLNPRPYGSLAQAIAAGANIPVTWCELLLGQEPQLSVAEPGRMFRWEDGEVGNVLAAVRAGRLRDAAAVMRPARGSVHSF